MSKEKSKQLIDELSKMTPEAIETAYLYALNYSSYGIDVTKKWLTATENARNLEMAYREGYYDALQKMRLKREPVIPQPYGVRAKERSMTGEEVINKLNSLKQYYNDDYDEAYVGFDAEDNEAIDMAIKALKQTRWIPVSERLPEDGQDVLFCDIDGDIMFGYRFKGQPGTHFTKRGTYEVIKDVRAWMPLPEKPSTESEEGEYGSN